MGSNSKLVPSLLYQNGWSATLVGVFNISMLVILQITISVFAMVASPKNFHMGFQPKTQLIMILALNRSWCFDHELEDRQQVVIHSRASLTRLEVHPKQIQKYALFGE